MNPETIVTLTEKQMNLCKKMTDDAVEYFRLKKANGRSGYKLFTDEDKQKRWNQTMCGVMAEIATMIYLDGLGIRHEANIMTHVDAFDESTYALPDFTIWFGGRRRILEVKSNQLHHNARFFRMLTPAHWLSYQLANSLVIWCATDIEQCRVEFFGFNDVKRDFTIDQMTYVKTCVDNFQLKKEIPCRHFAEPFLEGEGWSITLKKRRRSC